jgi:hypothetical protein
MPLIHHTLRGRRAAAAALAAAAAACGGRDPFAPDPANNADTQQTDILLYPLGSAQGPLGSAVDLLGLRAVRPGLTGIPISSTVTVPAANFDLAVDLAPDGRVRLLPARLVVDVSGVGQVYRTGLQLSAAPFDSIADAPEGGYQSDSAQTVAVGQSVIAQFQSSACAAYYAKLVVVSVGPAGGPITLRTRVNPNCSFRTLRPGRG